MNALDPLSKAIMLATTAHAGQLDKAGQPYILHPLRMVVRARATASMLHSDVAIVAALHDAVEDSGWTLEALARLGVSNRVVVAVDALTRRKGEAYEAYLARLRADPDELPRIVKRLDIDDNLDPSRLALLDSETVRRLRAKYEHARSILGA